MSLKEKIQNLKYAMELEGIEPEKGLGEELFLYASTLMPVVNVDLLVINEQEQVLLSWRDDPHCGVGWHIPGGCIRLRETFAERIQKTALNEFGTEVIFKPDPIRTFELFTNFHRDTVEDQRERTHFVSVVFVCRLPKDFQFAEEKRIPGKAGYLKWFDELPDDLLSVQRPYRELWKNLDKKILEEV